MRFGSALVTVQLGLFVLAYQAVRADWWPEVADGTAEQTADVSTLLDIGYSLADFAAFQRCFGPSPDATCRTTFDCNVDGEIGLGDYTVFHARFVDQNAPPCGMVLIPEGEFLMGDHHDGMESALPVHAVYVDSFYIGTYEVTNQQYADGLNWALGEGLISVSNGTVYKAGSVTAYCVTTTMSPGTRITWDGTSFGVVADKGDHPMVGVIWYGAAAYTNWRSGMEGRTPSYDTSTWSCDFAGNGFRLLTEAEWEKAARNGEHDPYYRYPWANYISGSRANYWGSGDPYETSDPPRTTPVGYYAANGGVYDMAGNVWEWCNDRWSDTYYAISPYDNPHGPTSGPNHVLRGGSWYDSADYLSCAYRAHGTFNRAYYGFRLALDAN
ncbi:MAG: formylglycine-generating enzyme family protein [Planctomycetota bacterium]